VEGVRLREAPFVRSAASLPGAISRPCLTDQPRLSSQASAASSTMDSEKALTKQPYFNVSNPRRVMPAISFRRS